MSLFFIDIEVRYPNTEFISLGVFFIKYLPKPIIVNGRSKSIIIIKIQNPIVNFLYYNFEVDYQLIIKNIIPKIANPSQIATILKLWL